MYLANKRVGARRHYSLRESVRQDGRLTWRELYDLGEDPSHFIVYPGGNSFYFYQDLVSFLTELGIDQIDRELELIFLPFLRPDIRRIVTQMTRLGRKKGPHLTREAMARTQSKLHLFDRRRLFYLRYGRLDSPQTLMRAHRCFNVLLDKSRDEIECYFQSLEQQLGIRERKQYLYMALDLSRYFPGDFGRLFPEGLDQEKLDQAFLCEVCRLNQDPDFIENQGGLNFLCEYLIPYAIIWFDHDFVQRGPSHYFFEEFVRSHRAYRPSPSTDFSLDRACRVFCLSEEEWRKSSRKDLLRIYRRLAMERHPDQGGGQDEFIELNHAYECLLQGK
ncbi:MAG: hypothetical protein V1742_12315 [Pseudomonadota bacterium]